MDKKTKRKFPVLFVLEGGIRMYDRSMVLFHTKVTMEEWMMIVEETIKYHNFLIALKEVGMRLLKEEWTKLHEYFLRGLEINVARMQKIDPLVVAKIDQETLLEAYKHKMEVNSESVLKEIQEVRDQMEKQQNHIDINVVSDL